MLRHWLVRNGHHVEDSIAYIKTSDKVAGSQLEQVIDEVNRLEWELSDVYIIEKATSKAYKPLSEFILEKLR